jgi:subtilisin-like proprotein convertase family protein
VSPLRSRILVLAFVVAAGTSVRPASLFAESQRPLHEAIASIGAAELVTTSKGTILDAYGLDLPAANDASVATTLAHESELLLPSGDLDIRLIGRTESLTGAHLRFQQFLDGLPVLGGEVTVSVGCDGAIRELHSRLATRPATSFPSGFHDEARAALIAEGSSIEESDRVILNENGVGLLVDRIIVRSSANRRSAWYVDASTGGIIRREALFFTARGRVFDSNPVVHLGDRSLRDHDDAASAVPDAAYSEVELQDLAATGPLAGPNVMVEDLQTPTTTPADAEQPLLFDRSQPQFEDVNVYFHLDRAQRYLQSLGYTGARRIIDHPIEVDPHADNGKDESFYSADVPGHGKLFFGTGGTDDAEDSDIVLHEYGHAIQDSIAPGRFLGPNSGEARALAEGFGDYWAFSSKYEAAKAAGSDLFCLADWDARCGEDNPSSLCAYAVGANCLRRVDGSKTMADFILSEADGTQHKNGEIWSSALREIFMTLAAREGDDPGRRTTDTIVLESTFGAPPLPTFAVMARKMILADQILDQGANRVTICSAMQARGILGAADCDLTPRGEVIFFQSADRDLPIPDANPVGITSTVTVADPRLVDSVTVKVDIVHQNIGDLKLVLTAPDGASVVLQSPGSDAATSIHLTYGLDADSAEPLQRLHGEAAGGLWHLAVIDTRGRDTGRLLSWTLILRYMGDVPLVSRPVATDGAGIFIPVVGNTPGADGTRFSSDVSIYNRGLVPAQVMLVFTPAGSNSPSSFGAFRATIDAGQVVRLSDVVRADLHLGGIGSLELQGHTDSLIVESRTFNTAGAATFGQAIPGLRTSTAIGQNEGVLDIPELESDTDFRTNVGFTDVAGAGGTVRIRTYDDTGLLVGTNDYEIGPFGMEQVPFGGGLLASKITAARVEAEVLAGGARIMAYGSVIDNLSGDPIYVPARRRATAPAELIIPAAIHADGALDTHWRSDLWVTGTATAQTASVTFHPAAGPSSTHTIPLGASSIVRVDDVIQTLFPTAGPEGQLTVNLSAGGLVTSRTWTPGATGSLGQFIDGVSTADAISMPGERLDAIGIQQSDSFRTNVGVTEIAGAPSAVRISIYDAAGSVLSVRQFALDAFGQLQVSLPALGISSLSDGRVGIEVTGGAGRVVGYASVIDNVSRDPDYITAR